jgi:hypothetical protein
LNSSLIPLHGFLPGQNRNVQKTQTLNNSFGATILIQSLEEKTPEQSRLLSTITAEILYTYHDPVAQQQFPAFQTDSGNCNQCHAAHEQD